MWVLLVCLRHTKSLVFHQWEKTAGSFFPLPFAVQTFHLIEACCSGSSESPSGWMKTQPMLSHLPAQSEWGRQLSNPLCNSFTVCDGGDTEISQMPFMLPTRSSAESSSHASALRCLHTIQRPKIVILQNCPLPHESLDKGAAGFELSYLV